ncbi:hypothetical protein SISSUDRAFT_197163 [Sistotremastrum suecicum HHB10207 ss-3]|uniref:Prolyl 4-hydroxylase alpha subunit Fe(2+) 2OG dioxygenase domain-containing protein n=1 Tax=Sistotremastrum suecicum HHB10207 ss-3 TaxID=1314776 RepID=A0A166ABY5_9AGAM|nr:hypothetical protein SISSUDRAFT_197163 [Sistotremastrum suecicum HHB10207 ss-3]
MEIPAGQDVYLPEIHDTQEDATVDAASASDTTSDAGDHDSEEEENGSSDEEIDARIDDPCTDIKSALTAALAMKLTTGVQGAFAFSYTADDAPIPGLNITGLGNVPIPLTKRSAKDLIGVCELAPFGKGERTVVDRNVRDTWELSADKISFVNPKWNTWMNSTLIPEITKRLGVSKIQKCELYKLLVYEKGSHFLPHQDTEKSPGMFATLVIVLPTAFEGGQLHVSHGGQSKIFDVAEDSTFSTSIMAWYTDVRHEVKPITKGYRLALSYNLIAPTGVPKPRLSDNSDMVSAVRHVLLSWRQSFGPSIPEKLAYILKHRYSSFGIGNGVLKGADIRTVDILQSLAKECRFEIFIGQAELRVSGDIEDMLKRCFEPKENHSEPLTMGDVVDLSTGQPVHRFEYQFDHPGEFIPRGLDKGSPYREEDDGYMGNYAANVRFWYKQTVVMLWPKNREDDLSGDDWLEDISAELDGRSSTSPSPFERRMLKRILFRLEGGGKSKKALSIVCKTAVRWKDHQLWSRAAHVGKIEKVADNETLVSAALAFGFETLESLFIAVIEKDKSNAKRLNLVDSIAKSDLVLHPDVLPWCDEHRDTIYDTLKIAKPDDVYSLVAIAKAEGIEVMKDTIIPQLLNLNCELDFWRPFLKDLRANRGALVSSSEAVETVIASTLALLLRKTDPFIEKAQPARVYQTTPEFDPQPAIELIGICVELGSLDSCKVVFEKLQRQGGTGDEQTRRAWKSQVYCPLMTSVVSLAQPPHGVNLHAPPFLPFLETIAGPVIDSLLASRKPDWKAVLEAAKWCKPKNGFKVLETKMLSQSDSLSSSHSLAEAARAFSESWVPEDATETNVALGKLIRTLVMREVTSAHLHYDESQTLRQPPYILQRAKDILILCSETLQLKPAAELLARLKAPKKYVAVHVEEVALPFVRILCHELSAREISISEKPYGSFCRDILTEFLDNVIGPQPAADVPPSPEQISGLGCGCDICDHMISQLCSSSEVITIRRVQKDRTHLENQIRSQYGLTFRTIMGRSPHGLEITKPTSFTAFNLWYERLKVGVKAWQAIRPAEIRQTIFGDDHDWIEDALQIRHNAHDDTETVQTEITKLTPTNQSGSSSAARNLASHSHGGQSADHSTNTKRSMPSSYSADHVPRKRSKNITRDDDLS